MSEKTSKFHALLHTRKVDSTAQAETAESPSKATKSRPKVVTAAPSGEGEEKRPRGRPKANGKRLNPDYTQVTAYIPSGLHTETKINLIRSGKREFSILIEELLTTWNKKNGSTEQSA